jgi:hypothetical protein
MQKLDGPYNVILVMQGGRQKGLAEIFDFDDLP